MPIILISLMLLLCSCQTLWDDSEGSGKGYEPGGPAPILDVQKTPNAVAPIDALELRLAQLWTKVDDLETQLLQQKERTKLIEKGMLLGIVPNELKRDEEPVKPRPAAKSESQIKLEVPVAAASPKEGSHDTELYRRLLQEAQDKFNRANYGQAIVLFNDIGSKFDDSVTEGSHHYWVGLSWFYLKEYKLSEESFLAFKGKYPANPWSNHATFYLAKIAQHQGLNQRALEQFQRILDENQDRDLGEMARAEIDRMKEKL